MILTKCTFVHVITGWVATQEASHTNEGESEGGHPDFEEASSPFQCL
jgi:hypothetical protein